MMCDIPLMKNDMRYTQYFQSADDPSVILGYQNPSLLEYPKTISIEEFFYEHLDAMAESALKDGVALGKIKVGKVTRRIHKPSSAFVESLMMIRLESVAVTDDTFRVDAIMKAKIIISTVRNEQYAEDTVEQWYRIPFVCTLGYKERTIRQLPISVYASCDRTDGLRLDQYLIRIIKNDDLDDVATQFLAKYYPEALTDPMPVSGFELASRMGYRIEYAALTREHSILGRFFFDEERTKVYDEESEIVVEKAVKANTILIDSKATTRRYVSREEDTLVHECVHGYLDRLPYLLQKAYHEDMECLPCPVSISLSDADDKFVRVIEARTAKLTARIRMPVAQTKRKIEELFRQIGVSNLSNASNESVAVATEAVVTELSRFYRVSKKTAELRLKELGYGTRTEAIRLAGFFSTTPQASKYVEKKWYQTYSISFADAACESQRNPRFAKLINGGRFLYVENHFCILDDAYVAFDTDGDVHMTEYARNHLSECCLLFEMRKQLTGLYDSASVLFLRQDLYEFGSTALAPEYSTYDVEKNAEQRAAFVKEAQRISQIQARLPALFSDTLSMHMDRTHMTNEQLAEKCGISTRTLTNWRNDEKRVKPLKQMVALCISLHLEPELSMDLLDKSGNRFSITEEDALYRLMLRTMYRRSLHDCDALLQEAGMKPFLKEQ